MPKVTYKTVENKRLKKLILFVETALCTDSERYALKYIRSQCRTAKFVNVRERLNTIRHKTKVDGVIYLGTPIEGIDPLVHTTVDPAWMVKLSLDPFWPVLLWGPKNQTGGRESGDVIDLSGTDQPLLKAIRAVVAGHLPWGLTKVNDPTGLIYPFVRLDKESYKNNVFHLPGMSKDAAESVLAQDLLSRARSLIMQNLADRLKPGYLKATRLISEVVGNIVCKCDYPLHNRGTVKRDVIIRKQFPLYKHDGRQKSRDRRAAQLQEQGD